MSSPLSDKMRALADGGHARAIELREKADALDKAEAASLASAPTSDTTKKLLGAWARARRVWSECSGEPLI